MSRLSSRAARAVAVALVGALLPLASVVVRAGAANLVRNPGCEADISGWAGYHATLMRVAAASPSGAAACRVAYGGSGGYYTLDDSPATVSAPERGEVYAASARVRADTATGKPVRLILRQRGGTQPAREVAGPVLGLGPTWARLGVVATIDAADRSVLEVYLAQADAGAGDSFEAADVSVALLGSASTLAAALNRQTYDGPLFSPASAWNAAATGPADPNSDAMLSHLTLSSTPFEVALDSATVPLYYADASTPRVRVGDSTGWWGGSSVPIPPQARPDPGSDGHLAVWDVLDHRVYEFWELAKGSGGWWAGYGVVFDADGTGYQTGIWRGSSRESGVSLVGGLIRYPEMQAGLIPHALAMSYPYTRGDAYARGLGPGGVLGIASMTNTDSAGNGYVGWGYLPEGARFRLKASVDVNARCGANRACQVIGTALQQYGAYVVDTGGWPVFYAENLKGKQVSWAGLLEATDTHAFQSADFEVLALPPLTLLGPSAADPLVDLGGS